MEFPGTNQEITKIFRDNKNNHKEFGFIPNRCHVTLHDFLKIIALFCSEFPRVK